MAIAARRLAAALGRPFPGIELFDRIADIVFFIKDREAVEELDSRERPRKDCGERRGRIPLVAAPAPLCGFSILACVFIKNQEPRHANV